MHKIIRILRFFAELEPWLTTNPRCFAMYANQTRFVLTDWFIKNLNWSQSFCSTKRCTWNAWLLFARRSLVTKYGKKNMNKFICRTAMRRVWRTVWESQAYERIINFNCIDWFIFGVASANMVDARLCSGLFWITINQTNSQLRIALTSLRCQKYAFYSEISLLGAS